MMVKFTIEEEIARFFEGPVTRKTVFEHKEVPKISPEEEIAKFFKGGTR